jgi:hypothetical protein
MFDARAAPPRRYNAEGLQDTQIAEIMQQDDVTVAIHDGQAFPLTTAVQPPLSADATACVQVEAVSK